jgi:hypothetical protein
MIMPEQPPTPSQTKRKIKSIKEVDYLVLENKPLPQVTKE